MTRNTLLSPAEREAIDAFIGRVETAATNARAGIAYATVHHDETLRVAREQRAAYDHVVALLTDAGAEISRLNERVSAIKTDLEATVMDREVLRKLQQETARVNDELRVEVDNKTRALTLRDSQVATLKENISRVRSRLRETRPALMALQFIADAAVRAALISNEDV